MDRNHPCNFKAGENDPTRGLTSETVAKVVKWKGTGQKFVAIDTPGLNDPLGVETDGKTVRDIIEFLQTGLGNRKVTLFVYVHKGSATRYNFHYLRMFHYMFGDELWSHMLIEVTFWRHTYSEYLTRREGDRVGFENEQNAQMKLNDLIYATTNAPSDNPIPVIFIDPKFNAKHLKYVPKDEVENVTSPQNEGLETLSRRLFHSNTTGFECENCNADFIPHSNGRSKQPIIPNNEAAIVKMVGTKSMELQCLVPVLFTASNCSQPCMSGWTQNGTAIDEEKISLTMGASGYMYENKLLVSNLKESDSGSYNCVARHCRMDTCEETPSDSPIDMKVLFKPPQILVDNRKALSFKCKQEVVENFAEETIIGIKKVHNGITKHLTKLDFDKVSEELEENKTSIIFTFHSRKLLPEDIIEENLKGTYLCTSQVGEFDAIENPEFIEGSWESSITFSEVDIDGGWSEWSSFAPCTSNATTGYCGQSGKGVRRRTRECNNPRRKNGKKCPGDDIEEIQCNGFSCPTGNLSKKLLVSCTKFSNPKLKRGEIDELIGNYPISADPYAESWMGIQDCESEEIIVTMELVDLNDLFEIFTSKCGSNSLTGKNIKIISYTVIVSKELEIIGLKKIDIESQFVLIKSDADIIKFGQMNGQNGQNGVTGTNAGDNGQNGTIGENGANGTEVQISTFSIQTEGPVTIIVSGGDGGNGGNGSDGMKGDDGRKQDDPDSRYYSDGHAGHIWEGGMQYTEDKCKPWFKGCYCDPALQRRPGSDGGKGGNGGNGGKGGDGGSSGYFNIKTEEISGEILLIQIPGVSGQGGEKGNGKSGGAGGYSSIGVSVTEEREWHGKLQKTSETTKPKE